MSHFPFLHHIFLMGNELFGKIWEENKQGGTDFPKHKVGKKGEKSMLKRKTKSKCNPRKSNLQMSP